MQSIEDDQWATYNRYVTMKVMKTPSSSINSLTKGRLYHSMFKGYWVDKMVKLDDLYNDQCTI